MKRGFVYVAAGKEYIDEAITSANSLKEYEPNIPISIYADQAIESNVFDQVFVRDDFEYHTGDSIISDEMIPYEHNIFLDTDTYVCGELSELFDVLKRFDLAVSFGSGRKKVKEVPQCVPEYNTGVIAYRDCKKVRDLFDSWSKWYNSSNHVSDRFRNQSSFTRALWESEVDYLVLPQEYNVRIYPGRGAYLTHYAKIMHGRHPDGLKKCSELANSKLGPRVYYQSWYIIYNFTTIRHKNRGEIFKETIESIRESGLKNTLIKGYQKIFQEK